MMSQANGLPETTGRHGECHLALVDADALSPSGLAVAGMGCPNCAIPVRTDPASPVCCGRSCVPPAGPEAAGLVFARRLMCPKLGLRSYGGVPCFSNAQRGR
jgi:hypothetical protein